MSELEQVIELNTLKSCIRHASRPDNPELLTNYLDSVMSTAKRTVQRSKKRQAHLQTIEFLLDVICDTYLPVHWRQHCLNHLYQPIFELQKLDVSAQDKVQTNQLRIDINRLCEYFFN